MSCFSRWHLSLPDRHKAQVKYCWSIVSLVYVVNLVTIDMNYSGLTVYQARKDKVELVTK